MKRQFQTRHIGGTRPSAVVRLGAVRASAGGRSVIWLGLRAEAGLP